MARADVRGDFIDYLRDRFVDDLLKIALLREKILRDDRPFAKW